MKSARFIIDEFGCLVPHWRYGFDSGADADLMRCDPPRTKVTHPYNYDPYTIWGKPYPDKRSNGFVYTDRLEQWDYGKYERLAAKHYRIGNTWERPFDSHNCKGHLIQDFLRDWFDDPGLELLRVIEFCNQATGYPIWGLDYVSTREDHKRGGESK